MKTIRVSESTYEQLCEQRDEEGLKTMEDVVRALLFQVKTKPSTCPYCEKPLSPPKLKEQYAQQRELTLKEIKQGHWRSLYEVNGHKVIIKEGRIGVENYIWQRIEENLLLYALKNGFEYIIILCGNENGLLIGVLVIPVEVFYRKANRGKFTKGQRGWEFRIFPRKDVPGHSVMSEWDITIGGSQNRISGMEVQREYLNRDDRIGLTQP